jgi:hypothetical protein
MKMMVNWMIASIEDGSFKKLSTVQQSSYENVRSLVSALDKLSEQVLDSFISDQHMINIQLVTP